MQGRAHTRASNHRTSDRQEKNGQHMFGKRRAQYYFTILRRLQFKHALPLCKWVEERDDDDDELPREDELAFGEEDI